MKKLQIRILFVGILIIIGISTICINKFYGTEKYINYGNSDYIFVSVLTTNNNSYCGTINTEDYIKWCNGEKGTIFVYRTTQENRGYRINISKIISIRNYGNKPRWLPVNFWY